jgi:prolyl-tRNA synthetase
MRWTRTYIPTLREDPADAVVNSHKLLLRAGLVRQLTAGVYTYLPLMQKVIHRISKIVREEMDAAGAIEVTMPVLHPAEIWQKSGRWEVWGKDQMRMKDRHLRDLVLGGTHEEAITTMIRGELKSYRQVPLNLYQIQVKFRDEIRPRFGLMRGREFIMNRIKGSVPENGRRLFQDIHPLRIQDQDGGIGRRHHGRHRGA